MNIEVCYASTTAQRVLALEVPLQTTVMQAIQQSGILATFPEIDLDQMKVGIFSQLTTLDHPVSAGDRIEIYRPLLCDPKQKRRERAARTKK